MELFNDDFDKVYIDWVNSDKYLIVPEGCGGLFYHKIDLHMTLSNELYAKIYVEQPEILEEIPFVMTQEIEHEILMLSI